MMVIIIIIIIIRFCCQALGFLPLQLAVGFDGDGGWRHVVLVLVPSGCG